MANGYSAETVGVLDGTLTAPGKADGRVMGAKVRVYQATFDLSLATVKGASGDTDTCFRLPAGSKPLFGNLIASATMGASATIAIGTAAVPAKYRAAATFTAVDTPTAFMKSSAADDAPLTADEDVIITIGTAALPGSGILTVQMFCSAR